ncbi:MAG: peptide chain release factor 3, partial [Clostridia bacterium]|nr:peptide chain release factor 3 [Clostridia bacterium]
DPFEPMEELETVLGIRSCPVNWPIGLHGDDFKGVYHRDNREIELYTGGNHGQSFVQVKTVSIDDPACPEIIGKSYYDKLMEDTELLDVAGDAFDIDKILSGQLTPMFFGSASNNFGVEPFLKRFLSYTKSPGARVADTGSIDPMDEKFTGFIFKIQANMNPAHRDRLAFMRVCSGVFEKGMTVWHSSSGERIKLAQPQQFMAQEHETVETAYPGDIIGLFDPGIFRLGDTLCTGSPVRYSGIPLFAPEFFSRVSPVDSMKRKQFLKGINQLSQEGAVQTFKRPGIGREEMIAGVVGALQMDVLEYRLKSEYGVEITRESLPYRYVRWIKQSPKPVDKLRLPSTTVPAVDKADRDVLFFENEWSIRLCMENNKGLELDETADRAAADAIEV